MVDFGRPRGSGKWGFTEGRSYRISVALIEWFENNGGREYMERLVPLDYRLNIERQIIAHAYPNMPEELIETRINRIIKVYDTPLIS